jgi:hypothetical protein
MHEDEAMAETAGTREGTAEDGVRFREQFQGWLEIPFRRSAVRLDLRATMRGWRAFQTDPHHRLHVEGTVDIDGLATGQPIAGTIAVFPDDRRAPVEYSLTFAGDDGAPRTLTGSKTQRRGNPGALWYDFTTLRFEVLSGGGRPIPGLLRIPPRQALRLLASLRGVGGSVQARLGVVALFGVHLVSGALKEMLGKSPSTNR